MPILLMHVVLLGPRARRGSCSCDFAPVAVMAAAPETPSLEPGPGSAVDRNRRTEQNARVCPRKSEIISC